MKKVLYLWLLFFFMGFVMINFPFLLIFDKFRLIFNVPLIYYYLIIGWLFSILVVYVFVKKIDRDEND